MLYHLIDWLQRHGSKIPGKRTVPVHHFPGVAGSYPFAGDLSIVWKKADQLSAEKTGGRKSA